MRLDVLLLIPPVMVVDFLFSVAVVFGADEASCAVEVAEAPDRRGLQQHVSVNSPSKERVKKKKNKYDREGCRRAFKTYLATGFLPSFTAFGLAFCFCFRAIVVPLISVEALVHGDLA